MLRNVHASNRPHKYKFLTVSLSEECILFLETVGVAAFKRQKAFPLLEILPLTHKVQ